MQTVGGYVDVEKKAWIACFLKDICSSPRCSSIRMSLYLSLQTLTAVVKGSLICVRFSKLGASLNLLLSKLNITKFILESYIATNYTTQQSTEKSS